MLPLCSATTCCSCHLQIPIHGRIIKSISPCLNTFDANFTNVDRGVLKFGSRFNVGAASFKNQAASYFYSGYGGGLHRREFGGVSQLTERSYQVKLSDMRPHGLGSNGMLYVDMSGDVAAEDQIMDFIGKTVENTDVLPIEPFPMVVDVNVLSGQEGNVPDIVNGMQSSFSDKLSGAEKGLNESFDTVTSSLTKIVTDANKAVDHVIKDVFSFVDKSGETAGNKLTGLSGDLKEASGKTGLIALDVLRRVVMVIEDSLVMGANTVGYAYSSAKQSLPPEYQDTLSSSEVSVTKIAGPVGTALQKVYLSLEGLEQSLGLDPNDPLIPFALFLGVSATLWVSYRILIYGGYAGDLSAESAMELLRGDKNAVLIDIRPENLRERDGIPDLRRTTRFRYACVTIPEVDGSVKKLLKGGKEIEDSLLAAVIRNLKIVEDRSKVLVMDADGTRSKGVARSLRKLGTKTPYLVQGGFRSWVEEGFRVKELKPETALTILNEDAEAILEEFKPTPVKLIGLGVGLLAATYSVLEWEKTLQFIGVIGIGQTIYRRLASYQDSEDLKQDVRLLLAPARLGGQAISWATGKLEPSRNGLPTSPSSSDVQSRVLQAAAKHESQPADLEEAENSSETVASGNEDGNMSEA